MKKLNVKISPVAEFKLNLILDYLEQEWSENVKTNFLKLFKEKVEQVSMFPMSCEESSIKKGLFKAIIEKNTSFYYRIIQDERIEIINLIDNRQDPQDTIQEVRGLA